MIVLYSPKYDEMILAWPDLSRERRVYVDSSHESQVKCRLDRGYSFCFIDDFIFLGWL